MVLCTSDSARGRFNAPGTEVEVILTGEVLVPFEGRAASLAKGFSAGAVGEVEAFVILIFGVGADSTF